MITDDYRILLLLLLLNLLGMHSATSSLLENIIRWQTSWKAWETRKKGQSFKEKITFARFREEIPQKWIDYYYMMNIATILLSFLWILFSVRFLRRIRFIITFLLIGLNLYERYIYKIKFKINVGYTSNVFEKYIPRMKQKGGRNRKQYNNKK